MVIKLVYGLDEIAKECLVEGVIKDNLEKAEHPFAFLVNDDVSLYGDAEKNNGAFYINNVWSKNERKGAGREFICYLFENEKIQMIEGESTPEAVPFWFKMGAIFPKGIFDEFIEDDDFEDLLPFKIHSKVSV